MQLKELRLKQFRSYRDAHFTFDPRITLITGKNGVGKTNLLEAIYVLMQGVSFRVSDGDMIQDEKNWWRIDGKFEHEERQVRYQLDHKPAKQLVHNDSAKRFTYKDRMPVVLFEPTDLQLIHGSPSRRRDAIDTMLVALSQPYKQALSRYDRALQQRNNILKRSPPNLEDTLFSWDILLSEYGVAITQARRELISDLNALLSGYYSQIAGRDEELRLVYKSELTKTVGGTEYISHLHKKLPLDRLRGTTSVGPHRDDMEFILAGSNAKQSASRGEVRTTLLALKLAYANLLERSFGVCPLILLDDVFSELDIDRQQLLLGLLQDGQTIISDTKHHDIGKVIKL